MLCIELLILAIVFGYFSQIDPPRPQHSGFETAWPPNP
jgi:hypothetical protein